MFVMSTWPLPLSAVYVCMLHLTNYVRFKMGDLQSTCQQCPFSDLWQLL